MSQNMSVDYQCKKKMATSDYGLGTPKKGNSYCSFKSETIIIIISQITCYLIQKACLSTQILDVGNGVTPPDLFDSLVILRGSVYPAPGGRCRVLKKEIIK